MLKQMQTYNYPFLIQLNWIQKVLQFKVDPWVSATASLKNNTDVDEQGVTSAFVFFNDNGEFIGGLTTGLDDDILQAGSKRGIETENPPFPKEQYDNIAEMEAWSYFMMNGWNKRKRLVLRI
ncbi:hypothetical protein ACTHQ4_04805 [Alkalicoccobacillus gibsonii]|uniref:hypothetical protein n=1 Tax=Alkalicoccobacillus gibsonii TaxID=79881 RepID=UPI003F7B5F4F